jgi:transcription termination/antitermination protein NusG
MEHNWYALWVKSRHEFITRDELSRKGIETFLPSVTKIQQWRDRKKNVEFPLFPGYLFVSLERSSPEFQRAIKTRGSVGLVSLVPGYPTPVCAEEIKALKAVVASGEHFDVYPHFQMGAKVRVRRGPLQGAEGVLAKKQEKHVFFVNVEILGRSVGLKISANDIEQA